MDSFPVPRNRRGIVAVVGRRAPVRALGLALAVALLATLLVPLVGPSPSTVAAQEPVATEEADAGQDDGETQDQADGTADGTETPVAEETPDAGFTADLQADPHTSGIHVNMHVCDRDHGNDFLQWSANCTPGGGFEFQVYGGGVLQQDAVDYFTKSDLPAGQYTIRQFVPQDYRWPTVFCSRGPSDGNGAGQVEVVTVEGYYEFALGANESIYCHWFNIPRPQVPVEYGELWLYKMICPVDYDFDYQAADQLALYNKCELYDGNAVVFNLYVPANGAVLGQFIRPDLGAYIWNGAPAGEVTVTESNWTGGGTPIVFCYNAPFDGPSDWYKPAVSGSSADLEILNGVETVCHWFTVPLETGALKITASFCPEGVPFDYSTADVATLATYCDLYKGDKVGFDLVSQVSGGAATRTTDPNNGGAATWEQLAAGGVTVTEQTQDGYGTPIVYCYYTDAPTEFLALAVQEWSASLEVRAAQTAVCDWFNIPASESGSATDSEDGSDPNDDDDGSITIYTWLCPAGYDLHAEDADLRAECVEKYEGVKFSISGPGGYYDEQLTGDDISGGIVWEDLAAGDYVIEETVPEGIADRFVLVCRGDRFRLTVPYVPIRAVDGEPVVCDWYNVPADGDGAATVVTYACPKGTGLDGQFDGFQQACTQTVEGVAFTLTDNADGSFGEYLTDADGKARWTGLRADSYYLDETLPTGYGRPVAFCDRYRPADGEQPFFQRYDVFTNESIQFDLAEGESIACSWFNIPIGDDTATVYINAHICPTGFDAAGADIFDLAANCQGFEDGVGFYALSSQGGALDSQTTGDPFDLGVRFDPLPAKELVFAGDGLYGYGRPIVFCEVTDRQGMESGRQQATVAQNDGTYAGNYYLARALNAGDTLICDWFDVPLIDSPDAGTLTISKSVCQDNGTDYYAADADTFDDNCRPFDGTGVAFDYDNHTSGQTETQAAEVRGQDGIATVVWAPTPAGPVTVAEHAWDGYGTPIVWCYATADGVEYSEIEVEVEDWSADFAIPAGTHVVCNWFNIPEYDQHHEDGGNVVVTKWVCPEGYDAYDLDLAELYERCDEVVSGVDFFLYGAATGLQGATDGAGRVAFGPLPTGEYYLGEELPTGYGEPIVVCWLQVGNGALSYETAAEFVAVGGQDEVGFGLELKSGTTWFCDWFNVPDEAQTLHKHRQTIVGLPGGIESREERPAA